MEPVHSTVVQAPPVQPHRLGQSQTPHRGGWLGFTLVRVAFLAFTGCFVGAAYGARHRPRDLAYAVVIYFLLLLLMFCVVKLEQLRHDPEAPAAKRRRVRIAMWVVSLALVNMCASRVADATPVLGLKLAVWAVAAVVIGILFYYLFCGKDGARCCDAEHGRAQADAGRQPEKAARELSPEEKV